MGSESGLPFLIGLTGGIASGKSTVCAYFERLGIDIVDADLIAREIVASGTPALSEIADLFGETIVDQLGQLDRAALREEIFADPEQRRQLEAITHPRIRQQMWRQVRAAKSLYVILAVPLLVEGGLDRTVDRVLVIDVSEQTQRERLAIRDHTSPEQIDQILAAQASACERLAIADDVIDNNAGLDALSAQVAALHRIYLDLAGGSDEAE